MTVLPFKAEPSKLPCISNLNITTMFFKSTLIAHLSDSDDELYEAELVRRHTEVETLLRQQKEKKHLEHQARKEVKIAEWK